MYGREGPNEYSISDGFHVCLTAMVPLLTVKVNTKPAWCFWLLRLLHNTYVKQHAFILYDIRFFRGTISLTCQNFY